MSDISPIEDGQRQSNPLETTASGRSRRPRREFPKFPENPIVIPPERAEAVKDLLRSINESWEQGDRYKSLLRWFDLPKESRDDVINTTLLQEAEPADRSLRSAQDATKGKPENLILQHYALFATPAVGKIIRPNDNDPVALDDVEEISSNPGTHGGEHSFRFRLMSLGLGQHPYYHDMDDFTQPNHDIIRNFSLEEEREFLVKLIPHITGDVKERLLSSWGIVAGIKHADLLTDPRLADDLEKPILGEAYWVNHLENFLAQGVFPSPEFFEEAFKRLKPENSDPHANLQIDLKAVRDTSVPASVFYFTMLRRITTLEEMRERHPEFGTGREEKIISYLLNDAFMEHALPYLGTEEAFEDNFVGEDSKIIFHNARIEATGKEAKQLKRQRLGEIIKAAVDYAHQKGNEEMVQRLTEREVSGVKFADFIS